MSASVNSPFHQKVQRFSSGTGSPGWSRKKGRRTVVCVATILVLLAFAVYGSPYVIGQTIIFSSCFFLLLPFFPSPNLSGWRLDVYHTLAHGVALVRI